METALQIFSNGENKINAFIGEDGEPWFYASDVCAALKVKNSRSALSRLEEDEKGVRSVDTLGGQQSVSIINESGLYSLTLSSKKKEAKDFKRWVTHDVIPAIRKTGKYEVSTLTDAEIVSKALIIAHETLAAKDKVIEAKNEQLALQAPIIENQRILTETDSVFTMDEGGKTLGISGRKLKTLLKQTNFFNDKGLPYQKYLTEGFFQVKLVPLFNNSMYPQPFVTGKGMILLTSWFKTMNHPQLKKKGLI